jgi:biotin transport system substrate-specific component
MHDAMMQRGVYVVISLALLSLLGPLSINIGGVVPVTLQTFFVILPAMLFRWPTATIVIFFYLLLGCLGLPVFAGYTGGFQKLLGASGGYLVAFFIVTMFAGWLSIKINPNKFFHHLLAWLAAHIFIIVFGLTWQLYYTGGTLTDQLQLIKKLMTGAFIKSAAGALISFYWHTSAKLKQLLNAEQ